MRPCARKVLYTASDWQIAVSKIRFPSSGRVLFRESRLSLAMTIPSRTYKVIMNDILLVYTFRLLFREAPSTRSGRNHGIQGFEDRTTIV